MALPNADELKNKGRKTGPSHNRVGEFFDTGRDRERERERNKKKLNHKHFVEHHCKTMDAFQSNLIDFTFTQLYLLSRN